MAKLRDGIKQEIVSHWHPNITVNLVFDYTNWVPGQVRIQGYSFIGLGGTRSVMSN